MKLTKFFSEKISGMRGDNREGNERLAFLQNPQIFHNVRILIAPQSESQDSEKKTKKRLNKFLTSGKFLEAAEISSHLIISLESPTKSQVLDLFYVRLVCLQLLGLHHDAAQEADILDLNEERRVDLWHDTTTYQHMAPWELRVLTVGMRAIVTGSWRDAIREYETLTAELRVSDFRAPLAEKNLWQRRADDLLIRTAYAMKENGDHVGAADYISQHWSRHKSDYLARTRIALLFLSLGDVAAAKRSVLIEFDCGLGAKVREVPSSSMFEGIQSIFSGKYTQALDNFNELRLSGSWEDWDNGLKAVISQNMAVCHVYTGNVYQAAETLKSLVKEGPDIQELCGNLAKIREVTIGNYH